MGISGSDKALMYALSGVARACATRSGYHSPKLFIAIGGVHFATGRPTENAKVREGSLQIQKTNGQAHTATFQTMGFLPAVGLDVVITMGSKNSGRREFAGQILSVDESSVGAPSNFQHDVSVIDYTWGLKAKRVIGRYTGSASTIARALIATWAPGYTADSVEDNLGTVTDGITFTDQDLWTCLTQLAARVGAYWYIDYFKNLHFYRTAEAITGPRTLTASLSTFKKDLRVSRALGSVITRVFVEGGGGKALTALDPGATMIPVDALEWYATAGGVVKSGPQRITYTGVTVGIGGGLVGPGAAPSSPVALAAIESGSLTAGARDVAVTFVTAAGESLPSPIATITIGPIAAVAPTPGTPTLGGNIDSGDHDYAITFKNGAKETTPSALARVTTGATVDAGVIAPPSTAPSVANFDAATAFLAIGDTIQVTTTYIGENGETTAGPWSSSITVIESVVSPGQAQRINVTNIPATGANVVSKRVYVRRNGASVGYLSIPFASTQVEVTGSPGNTPVAPPFTNTATLVGTAKTVPLAIPLSPLPGTARRLWRTKIGGTALHLVTEIANNIDTAYTDSASDASLSATLAPVSNTLTTEGFSTSLPIGPTGTTQRNIYHSAAGASQLKFAAAVGDNTTTSRNMTAADSFLGANAPVADTSGLQQPSGQVVAGATEVPVAGTAAFSSSGGWAVIGNGQQVIRYTGKSGLALTGIPATGSGSLAAAVSFNATVSVAPALTGIPASGAGAIQHAINQGDDVNLVVQVDDVAAQNAVAALTGDTGIIEDNIQDRRLSEAEARARGTAHLALLSSVEESVRYRSTDRNIHPAQLVPVNLTVPTIINRSYRIQQVTIQNFQPALMPECDVVASSQRFSFDDLLNLARKAG